VRRWDWQEATPETLAYRLALGLDVGDGAARQTVAAMGYLLDDPDGRVLGLLCDLLCYRPRASWRAAALAVTRYVTHVPERRVSLAAFLRSGRPTDRHRVVVAYADWARGAELEGLGETWIRSSIAKANDVDSMSAVLDMAAVLARDVDVDAPRVRSIAEAAIAAAVRFARPFDYQLCAALRDVAEANPGAKTPAAWGLLLDEPPLTGGPLIGARIDAGATARWLATGAVPDADARLARLRAGRIATCPGVEAWALAAAGGPAPRPPVDAAIERLQVLAPDHWRTTSMQARGVALAELVWILRHPELAPIPWASLAARAGVTARREPPPSAPRAGRGPLAAGGRPGEWAAMRRQEARRGVRSTGGA